MESLKDCSEEPDLDALNLAIGLLDFDPLDAEQKLKALAEKGSVHSMLHLGHLYWVRPPELGGADLDQSEHWFLLAYKAGSKIATFYLGRLYLKKQDYAKAREAFENGIEMQYPPSIFHLARMNQLGLGGEIRRDRARDLYERASDLGHIYAKRTLGGLLFSGKFGFMNIFRGLRLIFRSAAECSSVGSKDPNDQRLLR